MPQTTTGNKFLTWSLGVIASLGTYISVISKREITTLKEAKDKGDSYYQAQIDKRDRIIVVKDSVISSLQNTIINRTDQNYNELKELLDINNKKSTIIIKPKK